MATLYIPIGIPGSGKTTYGKDLSYVDENLVIVSPDKVRGILYGDISIQGDGREVFSIAYYEAIKALKSGKNVYFDATNLTPWTRFRLYERCKQYVNKVIAIEFHVSYDSCLERNKSRNRKVPERVIKNMSSKISFIDEAKEHYINEIYKVNN